MNDRLQTALDRFDAANAEDTGRRTFAGREYPHALLYGQRMSHWLGQLAPDASEALQLAARSQHICRWKIPRDNYPRDRAGYYRWRIGLYDFHATTAGAILAELGYDAPTIVRVQSLLRKKDIKTDAEMQTLEDVACLVFLESDLARLCAEHDEAKMIDILQKTWKKMSSRGHAAALAMEFSPEHRALIEKALEGRNNPGS